MVEYKQITTTSYALAPEGSNIASSGSHEYRVWAALPAKNAGVPVTVPELKVGHLKDSVHLYLSKFGIHA